MKKICFAVSLCLLCFSSISCVIVPGIAIIGIAVMCVVDTDSDAIGPAFIFSEDTGGDKYANIGADIEAYSDSAEWHPNSKYRFVAGKITPGGSAESAGIKEGDILYNINGRFTERMSPHEAFSYLIGGNEETILLYVVDGETGLLKKIEVLKAIN
ncbi:MAG: PDZ domain-containing protein [Patescibacteria group bacterium]